MSQIHTKTRFINSTSIRLTAMSAALALFICLVSAQAAMAGGVTTFTVNSTADAQDIAPGDGLCSSSAVAGGICTLRAAITESNALAGLQVIILPAGTYTTTIATTNEDANANGDFDITQDLTITGAGAAATIVQANALANTATDRVFHNINAGVNVTLSGMTVQNGRLTGTGVLTGRGGGIQNLGIMTLTNVTVTGNSTVTRAGGVHSANPGNRITLIGSTVTGNSISSAVASVFGGGMNVQDAGTTVITNSSITNNTATSTFADSFGFAAGFYAVSGSVTITGSNISSNTGNGNGAAGSQGTGLRFNNALASAMTVNITNTTINTNVGNTAAGTSNSGVGIAVNSAAATPINLTLTGVTINGNTGSASGAGISVGTGATIILNNSSITNNILASAATNNFGAGIAIGAGSTVTLNNGSVISGNSSTATGGTFIGLGGGVDNEGSTLVLNNSTVSNNTANVHGGIRNLGSATAPAASTSIVTLNNSTVSGNNATDGGGIVNIGGGTGTVTATVNLNNSTVSGNTATTGSGGGIEQFSGTGFVGALTTSISNSTIAFNRANNDNTGTADAGGGIIVFDGMVNLRSSIVASNSVGTGGQGPDIFGTIVSGNYNLIQNISGTVIAFGQNFAPNDITGVDPLLLPLGNNGGTTLTHALLMTSPAVDKGNAFGTTTDQRGQMRPADLPGIPNAADGSDIGAYEVRPTAASATVSGRVVLPLGNGLTSARVMLTDSQGNSRSVFTGKFGRFIFREVATGETYVVTVNARRYTFAPQVITVTQDVSELTFTPESQF